MTFTHVFITRPREESVELAAMLKPLGLQTVVQPAFNYFPEDIRVSQAEIFTEMRTAGADALVVFTSPRAVFHGLPQLPDSVRFHARIAAIGPATARALGDAGIRVNITPATGYTSEALLETLSRESPQPGRERPFAFIISAPGGRQTLFESLGENGWRARLVMAYRPEPAELDKQELGKLAEASGVLSVWTSANAMKALSQRLQPSAWFPLCQGDWLVISDRLRRLARAYGPARIHLSTGPGNRELFSAIRNLG
jgi:uroporphyrinogen-III synthase